MRTRADSRTGGRAGIVGRTYAEHGRPVVVLVQWGTRAAGYPGPAGGPRNVRIRRADGSTTIRPFRGLRRPPVTPTRPLGGPDE